MKNVYRDTSLIMWRSYFLPSFAPKNQHSSVAFADAGWPSEFQCIYYSDSSQFSCLRCETDLELRLYHFIFKVHYDCIELLEVRYLLRRYIPYKTVQILRTLIQMKQGLVPKTWVLNVPWRNEFLKAVKV